MPVFPPATPSPSSGALATFTTPRPVAPYITVEEYKTAPTAVDISNLDVGGTGLTQDSELLNVILRASAAMDNYCNQILSATQDIEVQETRIDRRGRIVIHPDFWPVLELRDVQYGVTPNSMVSVDDLSNVWILRQQIFVHLVGTLTSVGPLQFGAIGRQNQPIYLRYTYVNGWPNTLVGTQAVAGSNVVEVQDVTGIYGGTLATIPNAILPSASVLTIYDGADTEQVSVGSVSGSTLLLNHPLRYDHQVGVSISALPADIKQAAILMTSALIKTRGDEAIVMASLSGGPTSVQQEAPGMGEDMSLALDLLAPYRRVR